MIRVSTLTVAPVKGLAALARPQVQLEYDGVAEDRRLFLLRDNGSVLTVRHEPRLAAVVPDLDLNAGSLRLSFPDGRDVTADLGDAGEAVSAELFGKDRTGRVLPGPAAAALTAWVGEPVRLVLAARTGVGWDEGPVSLVGRASAEAVDTPRRGNQADTARYRMLVEIDGTAAYEEDGWVGRRVRIGSAVVEVSHALGRCLVINADPRTGAKDWNGLKTLADRRGQDQLTLGVIARVVQPGRVSLGDEVEPR